MIVFRENMDNFFLDLLRKYKIESQVNFYKYYLKIKLLINTNFISLVYLRLFYFLFIYTIYIKY